MKYTETLKNIHSSLDKLGDLPIFSATVNRIQQISASEESDAMALAMAIMKDTSLSARLLKLANSSTYNRGAGNISVVSRAVVLMGFNRIKNICLTLKLIENFHDEHPDLDVPGMMMRQFLSANLAKEFALHSKQKVDPEEAYIAALLFGLGEIMVACTLPDQYRKMLSLRSEKQTTWALIQEEVLGMSFHNLGQEIAVGWGYPKSVLSTMNYVDPLDVDADSDLLGALPSLTNGLIQQLYGQDRLSESYSDVIDALSEVGGMSLDDVGETTLQCFRQVAKVSRDYGLKSQALVPQFIESGNSEKDEMVRKLAFLAQGEVELDEKEMVSADELESSIHEVKRSKKQLDYMNDLNELITSGRKIHEVFKLVIEAIRECAGFDRSMLCLLNSSRNKLSVKMIEGEHIQNLQDYFERSKNGKADDLFFRVLNKQVTLLVNDLDEDGWADRLPNMFIKQVKCQGFVLVPLTMGNRVIGMLYADKLKDKGAMSEEDFGTFNQFATQTRLALMYAESRSQSR